MGLFPLFMSPTSATSVTFALGLSSFLYYNYIGISENGVIQHFKHFAGPIWWIAPLIFPIEMISNLIRPFSLGIRLFGNLFADEKVIGDTCEPCTPMYLVCADSADAAECIRGFRFRLSFSFCCRNST